MIKNTLSVSNGYDAIRPVNPLKFMKKVVKK